MVERFQPRTVASFNRHQLETVMDWVIDNGVLKKSENDGKFTEAFLEALDRAEFDEKGKVMSEKGRNRLIIGLNVIETVLANEHKLEDIKGVLTVQQLSPKPNDLRVIGLFKK